MLGSRFWRVALSVIFVVIHEASAASSPVLSLPEYLDQVQSKHAGFRGARESALAATQRSVEGSLLFSPSVISEFRRVDDRRPTVVPLFQGTQTVGTQWSLGVGWQTRFGLQAKLNYLATATSIFGADPSLLPYDSYFESSTQLEVALPLWRNAFGRATRSDEEAVNAAALSAAHGAEAQAISILAEAEEKYWELAQARQSGSVLRQALERADSLAAFIRRRERLLLEEKSDLLQVEAMRQARTIELQASENQERAAARALNSLRGVESEEVPEELRWPDDSEVARLTPTERLPARADVKAAEEGARAASSSRGVARDRQLPSLELYGSGSLNGRDPVFRNAVSDSFKSTYPMLVFGARFSMPLDLGTVSSVRDAYAKEEIAADATLQRRRFDQETAWRDLTRRLEEAKDVLKTASALVETQRRKLEQERQRQRNGRSTTFQVTSFEQDLLLSELNRVRMQGQILQLRARMRTFGGLR